MAFNLFMAAILLFVIGNLLFFVLAPIKYHLSLKSLRKALYSIFILSVAIGLLLNEMELKDWLFLLILAAFVVFIDLSILLTPSIMKFWNAEFHYSDYVENVITTNEKIHKSTVRRVGTMSYMIQNAGDYFENLEETNDEDKKKLQLQHYLQEYAETYGFKVQVWNLETETIDKPELRPEIKEDGTDEEVKYIVEELGMRQGIENVLTEIEYLNSFDLDENRQSTIESLFHSGIVSLIKEDSMLVPVYMTERNMIVVVKNEEGDLLEVDAIHITNLIYLYYSFA